MSKINWKTIIVVSIWGLAISVLIYTRFINLGWGLPYPMHPDERNMAVAIQQLHCNFSTFQLSNLSDCFNPHFFAYGQFPLYLASGLLWGYREIVGILGIFGKLGNVISFNEATITLRIISATASVITGFIILKIVQIMSNLDKSKKKFILPTLFSLLIITFSPALIQFAHFGTTESLLMFFYSLIVYYSIVFLRKKLPPTPYSLLTAVFCGLAIATKISSVIFLAIPLISLMHRIKKHAKHVLISSMIIVTFSLLIFILFSPHTLISFKDFMLSFHFESAIALGNLRVFYTQQFNQSVPVLFQFSRIFPYALGLFVFLLFLTGFLLLPWNRKEINFLRLSFISYFLPNAFYFVKWTRFMAPIFPLMIIFAILMVNKFYEFTHSKLWTISKIKILSFTLDFALCTLIFALILPGIAYLSIYQNTDVRFRATEWIRSHIPQQSLMLSETANVVDVPLNSPEYQTIPFDFYNLDTQGGLQNELSVYLKNSRYIMVPSRRIFINYTCQNSQFSIFSFQSIFKFENNKCDNLEKQYPLLNEYYKRLFSGGLGFKQLAEFSSYPNLKFQILNFKFKMELPDEQAEETWSVFDHPVIRIYEKS